MYLCAPFHVIVDGHWSSWRSVGACSTDCGVGKRAQRRTCTNPAPRYGGEDCAGDDYQIIDCEEYKPGCVVDGK